MKVSTVPLVAVAMIPVDQSEVSVRMAHGSVYVHAYSTYIVADHIRLTITGLFITWTVLVPDQILPTVSALVYVT